MSDSDTLDRIKEFVDGLTDDVAIGIKRIVYPPRNCEECGQVDDVIGGNLCPCWAPVTRDDLRNAGLDIDEEDARE